LKNRSKIKSFLSIAFLQKVSFCNFIHKKPTLFSACPRKKVVIAVASLICTLIFCSNCNTTELKYIGTTNKVKEEYFYGLNYIVTLSRIDESSLPKIKTDVKNALSLSIDKNRIQEWKEISDLSSKDKDIFLFQIFPDTRVIPEFLEFSFECNGSKLLPSYKYYSLLSSTTVRSNVYQSYPIVIGLGPGYPYYYRPYPTEVEVQISNRHAYSFVFLSTKRECMNKKGDRFRIITPSGNFIDFERSI
jgi:hypothetical protein